jgi:TonB-linked SusC/RagA family outer membrane protein
MELSRLRAVATCVLACSMFIAAEGAAQARATISGRVTSQGSGEGLAESRVILVGTSLFTSSDQDGRYSIRNVPAGNHQVRVIRVGYQEQKKPITVTASETATLDFALAQVVVRLTEVVTTATGEQRKVELGTTVANIRVADVVNTAPVTNLQDVLNARAPGVVVTGGSQTGGGARVRIRGYNSLNLSNDPIYIIDGVRMTSSAGSTALFTGGASPSRVGDLNPEEIENIEIVKGPSAATLYGTDAANGVIVITTKKGRAGASRWTFYAEGGVLADLSEYPTNYTIAGHSPSSTTYRECGLPLISAGTCLMDSVRTLNIFDEADLTPIDKGFRHQFGGQLSGGTEAVRFFVAAERESETGVLKLPEFERNRLDSTGIRIADFTMRPNALQKYSYRANLNSSVTPKLDLGIATSYINLDQRFSTESNATVGLGSQVFGGPGYRGNGTVLGAPKNGYRAWTPGYTWQEENAQLMNRFIAAMNANWRPTSWMQNRGNIGLDYGSRQDDNLLLRGQGPPINTNYRKGFKADDRVALRNFSFDLGSTGSWQPTSVIDAKTTVGVQYVNSLFSGATASGEDLPPGTQTAGSAAVQDADERTTVTKTLGLFVEQSVSYRDRLFATVAVRTDQNSAFGTNFQRVVYPKASLSWVVSDENFFPSPSWLTQVRFRTAYGASGTQPGANDALRTFASTTSNIRGTDQPGVVNSAFGNSDLKPEKATEFEIGFETRLFESRANIEFTYYSRLTKDALISATLAPSLGQAGSYRANLGSVKNAGVEGLINAQIINTDWLGYDLLISGSANDNKLVSMGDLPAEPGTTSNIIAGFPLFAFWARPITGWDDKNGDGILTYNADPSLNEVFVGDDFIYRGYRQPRYNVTINNGLDLFSRKLRLTAMVDYRGGHKWYNNTERIRCVSRQNCNGLMNPDASFEEQAMVVATRDHPARTLDGFFQPGWFWRLREVTATYNLSERLASRVLRARSAAVNFSARNLWVNTAYRGIDPEIDRVAGDSSDFPDEFQTVGIPSYFILRLSLGF